MSKSLISDIDVVAEMAKKIFDMENSGDSSMKGVWLDRLVSDYVELHFPIIKEFYEFIVANQKETTSSYGDHDYVCTKMSVKNGKGRYLNLYDYTFEGMLLDDIFSSNKFLIVKEYAKHKEVGFLDAINFHIRKVDYNKKFKSIAYDKYINSDFNSMIVSFEINYIGKRERFKYISNQSGMLINFKKFRDFMFVLRQPVIQLKSNK